MSDGPAALSGRSGHRIASVASAKLLAPRPSRRLVPRDALQARLLQARRQRCVVVRGPAGSGKTSTLVAWRQALLALNFDVAWLSLSAEDGAPTRFFDCLLASIGQIDPDAVREAALLMGRDNDDSALEHAVITVVQAISARPRELVLMLDDLQHLRDARIFRVLQWLLDYAPPKLHLAFASRRVLPLSFARLRSQGLVSEFDLRDLRLSAEETERFLREQLGCIDKRDVQVLHELTDGWVVGLQLLVPDLQAKPGAAYARVQARDVRAFASYFESEVLVHLAEEDLALLTRLAVCNRFSASLCAALMGQQDAGGMALRLARLDGESLFISQVSGHERESWYRVHPLLREILMARLEERWSGDERCALHGAAWRWFEAHGHIDEAVRHAVLAGDVHAAADIVQACASDLMARGELTLLGGLMRRLPTAQVQARFALRLVAAYLHMYARNIQALESELAQLDAQWDTLDMQQHRDIALLRGGLALQRDDTEALLAVAPQLRAIPDDRQAVCAGRHHLLAWMLMHRDAYGEARVLLDEAAQQGSAPARRLIGRCLTGMSYALEGHMTEAEQLFREVLHEAQGHDAARIGVASLAAGLQSDVLYECNELEAACRLLEPRIEVLERASIPDAVLRAFVVLACAHWLMGRRLQALEHLDRLQDYAVRSGLDRLLAHALALRMRLYLKQGQTVQADRVFERIKALGTRHAEAGKGTAAETWRTTERARADMCLHWNDFDGAVDCLGPLVQRTASAGRLRALAALGLQLAVAESGRGNQRPARHKAIEALRLGHRLGLVRSLLDVSTNVPLLLNALLADAALDPVLAFYAQRLLDAATATRRARAGIGVATSAVAEGTAVDLLNEREHEVLTLVAQAMPNKKIARVLGVTAHTVKWHLRKIYSKLGVTERDEAVARMRDLANASGNPQAPLNSG